MKIESKLIFEKYLRLMYIMTYRKPSVIFISIIGLVLLVGSILYFVGLNDVDIDPPYIQVLIGIIAVIILPFSVFNSAKKNFSSNGRLQETINYDFSADKIRITGESFTSELDWAKTYKIIERKGWILIYQDKIVANIIPKESFGDNLDEFKKIVREKNIKNNFKK